MQGHGYAVPPEIQPIIDAYVAQDFDFLALKLVPGTGIAAMRPVRITTPGASPTLPLRMVAAGTGAFTTLKLLVLAEGRYHAANAPSVLIDRSQLVWSWSGSQSNYSSLRKDAWETANNSAWLVESSSALNPSSWSDWIVGEAQNNPDDSGYGDGDPTLAVQEATEDAAALFGALDPASVRLTFLTAELSKAALAEDLVLEAAADQSLLSTQVQANKTFGTPPCPNCGDSTGSGSWSTGSGMGIGAGVGYGNGGAAASPGDSRATGGCHYEPLGTHPWHIAVLALLAGLAIRRRSRWR